MQADKKKILSSLITTILIVSILAIPAPYAQASVHEDLIKTITPPSGKAGTLVTINGSAPESIETYPVNIYWSNSTPTAETVEGYGFESGYGYGALGDGWKLLTTVDTPISGTDKNYSTTVTLWNATAGTIYIIAWQDKNNNHVVDDGEWDYESFKLDEGIKLNLTKGVVGTPLTVYGSGFKADTTVNVWFDADKDGELEPAERVNSTTSTENGAIKLEFTVPTVKKGYTSYTVYATDGINKYTTSFTVEEPTISITPDIGGVDVEIAVEVNYFTRNKTAETLQVFFDTDKDEAPDIDDVIVSTPWDGLNATGGWSTTIGVPDDLPYGDYKIVALNALGEKKVATFTVLAKGFNITLSPTEAKVPQGGFKVVDVIVKAISGFTGTVTLSYSDEPEGVGIRFIPDNEVSLTATETEGTKQMNITVGSSVALGTYTITVKGTSGDKVYTAKFTLKVIAPTPVNWATSLIDKIVSDYNGSEIQSGPIGLSVVVNGTASGKITSDTPVKIYWSANETWDTTDKLLTTVKEPTKDTNYYKATVTIPDVKNSTTYYIIATYGNDYDNKTFIVEEGIYPNIGNVGDEVAVGGWNPNVGGKVLIYWDTLAPENKLAEVYSKASYNGSYSATITVPETVKGTYSIIVVDATKGTLATYTFTLKPKIKLSPSTAIPGDTIDVTGTGFAAEKKVTLYLRDEKISTTPSTVKTDENGSFSCSFKVPKDLTTGKHKVKAVDEAGNTAEATLKIGPAITLDPTSGPTGTIVEISGRGFTGEDIAGKNITVTIDGKECPILEGITVRSDGTFTGKFIIPTVEEADKYTIKATVSGTSTSATAKFEVTGTTSITLKPTSGEPGSTVRVEGVNFTAMEGVKVTFKFGGMKIEETTTTNSSGGFIIDITVPSVPVRTTPYIVNATDKYDLFATKKFRVAMTTLAVSPSSGPTGKKLLLLGGGFTPGKTFNVTIDNKKMIYVESEAVVNETTGDLPDGFTVYVPTVPVGKHTITVMDEEGVVATAEFEVTATTEIVLDPSKAPVGYNVTFDLNNFIGKSGVGIDLVIYNVTADGEVDWETYLDIAVGAGNFTGKDVETNATGCFVDGWFRIPESFALGDYYINATDEEGLTAEVSFSVVEPTVTIYTGADEYMRGDSVAFFAKSTFKYDEETINLYTPDNFLIQVPISIKTKVGELYTGSAQYRLPADAKLGTWFWNATISDVTVNGTFTVAEKVAPDISELAKDVASLKETVKDLGDAVSTLTETVSDLSDIVESQASDIDKLSTALSSLKEDVSNLSTAVSNAQSAAEKASEAAEAAQGATSAISMAVYGAVILSLIAAVAAIMSIVILQRKIAG